MTAINEILLQIARICLFALPISRLKICRSVFIYVYITVSDNLNQIFTRIKQRRYSGKKIA